MKKLIPLFIRLIGRLPLSWGRAVGSLLGRAVHGMNGRMRKVTTVNIQRCFPALSVAEQQQLVKESLRATGMCTFEAAQVWIKPHAWLEEKILSVRNQSLVEEAKAAGKGVLFLGPHLGNWEVTSPFICQRWGMTAMYAPSKNPYLDKLMLASRQKAGSVLVPASLKGVMALIKALKKGETVGILPDQVPEESGGKFADFFQQPALTMTLIHSLIKRSGCVAVMVYAKRVGGGFEMVFEAPDSAIYSEDESESLTALNQSVERCVKDCPEQYQWEYKRFRKQPEGLPHWY